MEAQNREELCQKSICQVLERIDLELSSEDRDEISEGSLFSKEYRPINKEGQETGRPRKIINLKKSNLYKLENCILVDAAKIDEELLEKRGLNVVPALYRYDAVEFEPKEIFRRVPIDYGRFIGIPMSGIRVKGTDKTFLEVSWDRNDEANALWDSLRKSDPFFNLVSDENEKITLMYNVDLKRAFKGSFLIESVRIMEDCTGHFKSPFDFTGLHNLMRELGNIRGINKKNYLKSSTQWLDQIDDDLSGWAYSVFQLQKTELAQWQNFLKKRLEKWMKNLQLENTRFWNHDHREGDHISYLKEALKLYRILAQMNAESSEILFGRLRDLAKDFGYVLEQLIDRLIY